MKNNTEKHKKNMKHNIKICLHKAYNIWYFYTIEYLKTLFAPHNNHIKEYKSWNTIHKKQRKIQLLHTWKTQNKTINNACIWRLIRKNTPRKLLSVLKEMRNNMLETGENAWKSVIEILNTAEFKWNFNRKTTCFYADIIYPDYENMALKVQI